MTPSERGRNIRPVPELLFEAPIHPCSAASFTLRLTSFDLTITTLTEAQGEAIRAAYEWSYYDVLRPISSEELAAEFRISLGIVRPTPPGKQSPHEREDQQVESEPHRSIAVVGRHRAADFMYRLQHRAVSVGTGHGIRFFGIAHHRSGLRHWTSRLCFRLDDARTEFGELLDFRFPIVGIEVEMDRNVFSEDRGIFLKSSRGPSPVGLTAVAAALRLPPLASIVSTISGGGSSRSYKCVCPELGERPWILTCECDVAQ